MAIAVSASSSVVVVGAHPDDVKSFTGVLVRALAKGARVHSVGVTNGERFNSSTPEEAARMGARRKEEQHAFLAALGVPREHIFQLGFANGCLTAMRTDYWEQKGEPYFAPVLGADRVIDADAYRPGAPFFGEAFLGILKEVIASVQPTHVLTHHPKDDHDEHRAVAFFVKRAVSELVAEQKLAAPELYASLVYFPRVEWPPAGDTFLGGSFATLALAADALRFELTP